jgi:GNAT superfamily N-acetyltransferase
VENARAATREDLPALCALAEAAIDELAPTRGGAIWVRHQAREKPVLASLETALDDPDALIVVGTIDDVAVGYSVVRIDELRDGGLLAVLDDLYVDPEARGVGLGEAMMDAVLDWARTRGCIGIDSDALPGNRATKNFFESFGLVARAIVVHKSLAPDDPLAPDSVATDSGAD